MTPETRARVEIDGLLTAAGWHVRDVKATDIHAARGVAIRELPLNAGHSEADYLLYIDGKAAGVIEAKGTRCWQEMLGKQMSLTYSRRN